MSGGTGGGKGGGGGGGGSAWPARLLMRAPPAPPLTVGRLRRRPARTRPRPRVCRTASPNTGNPRKRARVSGSGVPGSGPAGSVHARVGIRLQRVSPPRFQWDLCTTRNRNYRMRGFRARNRPPARGAPSATHRRATGRLCSSPPALRGELGERRSRNLCVRARERKLDGGKIQPLPPLQGTPISVIRRVFSLGAPGGSARRGSGGGGEGGATRKARLRPRRPQHSPGFRASPFPPRRPAPPPRSGLCAPMCPRRRSSPLHRGLPGSDPGAPRALAAPQRTSARPVWSCTPSPSIIACASRQTDGVVKSKLMTTLILWLTTSSNAEKR